jgi:hypothetical protein
MEDQLEDEAASEEGLPKAGASERTRAVYALSVAADLLASAESNNAESNFEESIALSRDSMRMASSAVIFLDGKVASDLESSCSYLKGKYDGIIPIDEWREVEAIARDSIPDRLGQLLGGKRQLEKASSRALESAARFFGATSAIVGESAGEEAPEDESGAEEESVHAQIEELPSEEPEDNYGEAS